MAFQDATNAEVLAARAAVQATLTIFDLYVQNGAKFRSPAEQTAGDAQAAVALAALQAVLT